MNSFDSTAVVADAMTTYISSLLGLIEGRDWVRFRSAVVSKPKTFRLVSISISDCADFYGMTLLHAIVRRDPPVDLLIRMIELYPKAMAAEDCLGRTPLHVAAGCGARPRIVGTLTANYPKACDVRDEDGSTPLHFACDSSCEIFEGDSGASLRGPPCLETVRILLAGSLEAVAAEDVNKMNPVEYALLSDAPIEVIKLLQRATKRVMKGRAEAAAKADAESQPRMRGLAAFASRIGVH